MSLIQPYVKSAQVCVCPSWTQPSHYFDGNASRSTTIPYESYTAPALVAGLNKGGNGGTNVTRSLADLTKPSETIYGLDGKIPQLAVSGQTSDGFYWGGTSTSPQAYADTMNNNGSLAPHFDGSNVFFLDGHVKWRKAFTANDFTYNQ